MNNAALHPVTEADLCESRYYKSARSNYLAQPPLDYKQLKGIETQELMSAEAVSNDQRILIVGDYDADGATSSAVVVRAPEKSLGATNVDYLVPTGLSTVNGLTPEIVAVASVNLHPDVLITVDNGISSIDGVVPPKNTISRS